jgi:hypothetical protein
MVFFKKRKLNTFLKKFLESYSGIYREIKEPELKNIYENNLIENYILIKIYKKNFDLEHKISI